MNTVSFMGANFVARQTGYHMTAGWSQGEQATEEYFRPLDTFGERFEQILREVQAMGFTAMDVWTAHLNWAWASQEHIRIARELLHRYGLGVPSLAGGFGGTADEFEAACRLAVALDTTILGGGAPFYDSHRDAAIAMLHRYGLKLAIENHPGALTPAEILPRIGDGGGGVIGTTVDTGWYGSAQYDAVGAIEELGRHILHVHLKDVRAPGSHDSCRYGAGVVPIEGCVRALQRIGYAGAISVEHEPDDADPTEDCVANLAMLRGWLEE